MSNKKYSDFKKEDLLKIKPNPSKIDSYLNSLSERNAYINKISNIEINKVKNIKIKEDNFNTYFSGANKDIMKNKNLSEAVSAKNTPVYKTDKLDTDRSQTAQPKSRKRWGDPNIKIPFPTNNYQNNKLNEKNLPKSNSEHILIINNKLEEKEKLGHVENMNEIYNNIISGDYNWV